MYFPLSTDTLVTFKLIENNLKYQGIKSRRIHDQILKGEISCMISIT